MTTVYVDCGIGQEKAELIDADTGESQLIELPSEIIETLARIGDKDVSVRIFVNFDGAVSDYSATRKGEEFAEGTVELPPSFVLTVKSLCSQVALQ